MIFTVRRMLPREVSQVMDLVWRTYSRFEGPQDGPEGPATFREKIIDNAEYLENCRSGENAMWGAFAWDGCTARLAGVMVMKGSSHISLVYTEGEFHRHGVASLIFQRLLSDVRRVHPEVQRLTLNASPFGKPFYLKKGFVPEGEERVRRGIRTTPMVYTLS